MVLAGAGEDSIKMSSQAFHFLTIVDLLFW